MHSSNHIIKFADDTTVVGLISKNNESAYREEMQQLIAWCKDNNLSLNIDKTKEMVVDFRRAQSSHSLLVINGSSVEIIKSTKFFGVHLAENFTWSLNTTSITKKTQQRLCFLWRLRKPISVPHPDREGMRGAGNHVSRNSAAITQETLPSDDRWMGKRRRFNRQMKEVRRLIEVKRRNKLAA
ncbi:hypothetical protein QTP70_007504 [Hemibagrus guttatus]|uniref:Reverse transcriptase domain-containing protein n=1 Tax=Hemibagrus guttatus TaxID=175788 RepID=A0AAE0VB50_9TELE|nr:hypothetical protein QTP70_007504 [Hemibagrus guttatus]